MTVAAEPRILESVMYRRMRWLESKQIVRANDSYLLVFAGDFDRAVFEALGFENFHYSNVSPSELTESTDQKMDARNLAFDDGSFDHVVAHAGIHHTSRPHQAVCEMIRVARKSAIFFEAQDSLLMRLAIRARQVASYEWNAIFDTDGQRGGVDDRPIPNYVYRWTRREVEKLVRSLDPTREPRILYMEDWTTSYERLARRLATSPAKYLPKFVQAGLCAGVTGVLNSVLRSQGNCFGVCIDKENSQLQPWIRLDEAGEPIFVESAVKPPTEMDLG